MSDGARAYRHSATTRAVLCSLVPVICPPEAAGLASAIVDHVELTLGVAPAVMGHGFAAGLAAYDLGAVPRYLRRARALTGERAERYFASWENGPTPLHVQLARVVNQLMSLACYEQPEIMEAVGYRVGPWIEEVRAKRLRVFADDIRAQQQRLLAPDPLRKEPAIEVA